MSIDLGAILATVEPVARGLIETSGTTVNVTRTHGGRGAGTVDPDTLARTDEPPTTVYAQRLAFLAPMGIGSGQTSTLPQPVDTRIGDYLALLTIDTVDVAVLDTLTVTACRDPLMLGRQLDVRAILEGSAGALRLLHVRPRTQGPAS